jgi:outer membrane protein W
LGVATAIVRTPNRRVLLAALLLLSASGCGSASQQAQMNQQSLVSDARDGALLADQVVHGRASSIFARAHAQELLDDVDQLEQNVTDEKLPGHESLRQAADQVSTALGTIVTQPHDTHVAAQAGQTLNQVADHLAGGHS